MSTEIIGNVKKCPPRDRKVSPEMKIWVLSIKPNDYGYKENCKRPQRVSEASRKEAEGWKHKPLNNLKIEIKFTAKNTSANPLTENSATVKSVKESASQLGLDFEEEE